MVSEPITEMETEPQEETEQQAPDPTAEALATIVQSNRRLEGQLGYLGRQLERLVSQPPTVARDERVNDIVAQLEAIRLERMEPEQQAEYYRQKAEDEAKRKQAVVTAIVERPAEPSVVQPADAVWATVRAQLKKDAEALGVSFQAFWDRRVEPRIANQELRAGPTTEDDPLGFLDLGERIRTDMKAEAKRLQAANKPRAPIDTNRGSGSGAGRFTREDLTSTDPERREAAIAAFYKT